MNNVARNTTLEKVFTVLMAITIVGMLFAACTGFAFASNSVDGDLFTTVGNASDTIYSQIRSVGTKVAIAAEAFCLIMAMIFNKQKSVDIWRGAAIGVAGSWIVLMLLPQIMAWIGTLIPTA